MLKDHFYKTSGTEALNDSSFKVKIILNKESDIFKGHFPGLPVVPGVCMMAIIKEQLQDYLNRTLILINSSNMKFLSLINPLENDEVDVTVKYSEASDGTLVADGIISAGELIFFKLTKAVYR
jgi:3-hydroxyacyl-[acyl-carrier-protein] dehydratase